MSRTTLIGLLVLAALAIAGASYAQRRGGRGGRSFGGYGGAAYSIRPPDDSSFTGDFTFCRLMFRQAPDGDGAGWGVDYPRADQNLSIRPSELTRSRVNFDKSEEPNYYVMQATDSHLFECPFVMMTEPGGTYFDEDEAKALRTYLLKGGFLWADDFWGEYAWAHWVREVAMLPDHPDRDEHKVDRHFLRLQSQTELLI